MIKSGNNLIQIYAIIVSIILLYYGIYNKDYILILGAICVLCIDIPLVIWDEQCEPADRPIYDLSLRSGNKLIQMSGAVFGLYIAYKYYHNKYLLVLGIIMALGDGYLWLFEKNKNCRYV